MGQVDPPDHHEGQCFCKDEMRHAQQQAFSAISKIGFAVFI
jgi:hypothetical protein